MNSDDLEINLATWQWSRREFTWLAVSLSSSSQRAPFSAKRLARSPIRFIKFIFFCDWRRKDNTLIVRTLLSLQQRERERRWLWCWNAIPSLAYFYFFFYFFFTYTLNSLRFNARIFCSSALSLKTHTSELYLIIK